MDRKQEPFVVVVDGLLHFNYRGPTGLASGVNFGRIAGKCAALAAPSQKRGWWILDGL